jgi:acetylglutamate kinase
MKYLIIKIGGSIISELPESFFESIVKLKNEGTYCPVIVHGGGPKINEMLQCMQIESTFHNGLRISSPEVVDTAGMVLSGDINKKIVAKLLHAGGWGFGFSGIDGAVLQAEPEDSSGNLGNVGKITVVDTELISLLCRKGYIPVISPISYGIKDDTVYNVNADSAASACASALGGNIVFVSDIPGVMNKKINESFIYSQLTEAEVNDLIAENVITGGMIPKVQAALMCLQKEVKETVILNGWEEGAIDTYAQGGVSGTRIVKEEVTYV